MKKNMKSVQERFFKEMVSPVAVCGGDAASRPPLVPRALEE